MKKPHKMVFYIWHCEKRHLRENATQKTEIKVKHKIQHSLIITTINFPQSIDVG